MKYIELIILAGLVALLIFIPKSKNITVAPSCFVKEDCIIATEQGYCGVNYDCIGGKCIQEQVPCKEICTNGVDDNGNSLIDCNDPDCYKKCDCKTVDYKNCLNGNCACNHKTQWVWDGGYCKC